MSNHAWVKALYGWGCTFKNDSGEQCGDAAMVSCLGRRGDCDGNEGRCKTHLSINDFPSAPPSRHCRYCRSTEHFGDKCSQNPWHRGRRRAVRELRKEADHG